MLAELLKYERLGNKDELLFFLFDGLSRNGVEPIDHLRKYCITNMYSISRSFDGIVKLLEFMNLIEINDGRILCNAEALVAKEHDKDTYFSKFHFHERLFYALKKAGALQVLFNPVTLKYNVDEKQYYLLDYAIPYSHFSIRNVLLATGFLMRDRSVDSHLLINTLFSDELRIAVIEEIATKASYRRRITLEELKRSLQAKEEAGIRAEKFVLRYEKQRLSGHMYIDQVTIVSSEYSNAGYDIESYSDLDSIFIDRYIEVKSFQGDPCFYWSKNEIETAKLMADKYYLYIVDSARLAESDYEPLLIQDPYKRIFSNEIWDMEAQSWRISLSNS